MVYPVVCIPLSVDNPRSSAPLYLHLAALYHVVFRAFDDLTEDDRILVHDPHPDCIRFIQEETCVRGVRVICTTTQGRLPRECLQLHPNVPERTFQVLDKKSIAMFLDFGTTDKSKRIADKIRSH